MSYQKKPDWLRKRVKFNKQVQKTRNILSSLDLHSVCENAQCPNMGECFAKETATFMIMGNICTRNCSFCAVASGEPGSLDDKEPEHLAQAVKKLGLKHVVITSVTRDDLKDGGASHFSKTIKEIKKMIRSQIIIEVLTPDFQMKENALKKVINTGPDIFNHNLETVPRLYSQVRPEADYGRSLKVLNFVKQNSEEIYTKSGIMLGLGEKEAEVVRVMEDLREVDCDILTIGQYLQPGFEHIPVKEYIKPKVFAKYEKTGKDLGFKFIAAGPYVRSSYQAEKFSKKYLKD